LLIAMISGALLGLLGLRPLKVALGLLVGAIVGVVLQALGAHTEPALVAAAVRSSIGHPGTPQHTGEHDLLLTSRSELAFPGHYEIKRLAEGSA
jgi:hypothetical protein